jgi:tetratricopeptide (TPR) repeat protein
MCWPYRHRLLQAPAVFAALVLASPANFSQTPDQTLPQIPVQTNSAVSSVAAPSQSPLVVTQNPPTAEELGDSLMTHQRYQAAIESYKKAPRASADVWNKMGIAYQLMFNLEEASHCYQTSLKLDPRNARVLNNLGTIYDSLKEYSNAERMYHKALKLDPKSAMIYKNLGTNLLAQRKYKKGWEVYKTALEIDPHIFQDSTSPRVQNPASVEERGAMNYYMAKGCVRAGMNDCAIEYLRMALNEGFTSPKKIEADIEFAALRGIPAFEQLLAAQKQQ